MENQGYWDIPMRGGERALARHRAAKLEQEEREAAYKRRQELVSQETTADKYLLELQKEQQRAVLDAAEKRFREDQARFSKAKDQQAEAARLRAEAPKWFEKYHRATDNNGRAEAITEFARCLGLEINSQTVPQISRCLEDVNYCPASFRAEYLQRRRQTFGVKPEPTQAPEPVTDLNDAWCEKGEHHSWRCLVCNTDFPNLNSLEQHHGQNHSGLMSYTVV